MWNGGTKIALLERRAEIYGGSLFAVRWLQTEPKDYHSSHSSMKLQITCQSKQVYKLTAHSCSLWRKFSHLLWRIRNGFHEPLEVEGQWIQTMSSHCILLRSFLIWTSLLFVGSCVVSLWESRTKISPMHFTWLAHLIRFHLFSLEILGLGSAKLWRHMEQADV